MLTISYFSKFHYSFEKNSLFPNIPKNHQKIYKTPKTLICVMSVGFLYCLKRERDISVKPILGGVKTAFRCVPALREGNFFRFSSQLGKVAKRSLLGSQFCNIRLSAYKPLFIRNMMIASYMHFNVCQVS